jgi:hypothetical protein
MKKSVMAKTARSTEFIRQYKIPSRAIWRIQSL